MISPRDFHYLCKYKCISSYIRGAGVGTERSLTDNNSTFCFTFRLRNCHTERRKAKRCEPGGVGCEPADSRGVVLVCVAGRQSWAFSDGGQTVFHPQAWEYLPAEGAFWSAVIKGLNASFITIVTATYRAAVKHYLFSKPREAQYVCDVKSLFTFLCHAHFGTDQQMLAKGTYAMACLQLIELSKHKNLAYKRQIKPKVLTQDFHDAKDPLGIKQMGNGDHSSYHSHFCQLL